MEPVAIFVGLLVVFLVAGVFIGKRKGPKVTPKPNPLPPGQLDPSGPGKKFPVEPNSNREDIL